MRRVGEREDIGELARRLERSAEILGALLLRDELLLLNEHDVDEAARGGKQERQLIRAVRGGGRVVRAFLKRCEQPGLRRLRAQTLQHERVCKRARRIEQAVRHRQAERQPGLCVFVVGGSLTRLAKLVVLGRFHDAEADDADADQRDRADDRPAHTALDLLVQRAGDEAEHRHQRAGGVADGRRDGKLNIPQADIAQRHRADVEQRYRQVRPDDLPRDRRAADENFIRRMQTHDHADGHDHFQMCVFVLAAAADLREQIRAAPAEERDE